MLLVKPSVEILAIPNVPLQIIELAGRTCYKSEDKITEDSNIKFVKGIISRNHLAVIEHVSATVKFICDRGVSHEIVRHRIASYCQESTRYCDYVDGNIAFVIPPWLDRLLPGLAISSTDDDALESILEDSNEESLWLFGMQQAENTYKKLREFGWSPQQTRAVLPNSLKTEVVMTANLREWRTFFELRTAAAAHPQMREVAIPLLHKMNEAIPVVFEDLVLKLGATKIQNVG